MAYSTIDNVSKKIDQQILIQLLNDEGRNEAEIDLTDSDDEIVVRFNQIAEEVAEEIDTYLRGRYKLPLSKSSSIIQSISDDRVIYNIKKRRMRDDISASEQNIYDETTKQLIMIQRGDIVLDADPVSADTVGLAGEIRVNKTASDKIFNSDMWKKY
ncbi:phage protein Gp36 family protein [Melioribacter sp. OK-6-Me]|uniref:phage protein Gp36 family protein n=1 Tax=unclassified Melioribacter TaxID=2627329 RepID=UPI003ED91935